MLTGPSALVGAAAGDVVEVAGGRLLQQSTRSRSLFKSATSSTTTRRSPHPIACAATTCCDLPAAG